MKVMVTGSRHWDDKRAIHSALGELTGPNNGDIELYVGDCATGADAIATAWWTACVGFDSLHVVRSRGPRPYQLLSRNQLLVDVMPDLVLGFVLYGQGISRGTYDTLNRAREAGLALVVQERPASPHLPKLGD